MTYFRQDEADLIHSVVSKQASTFNQDAGIFSAKQLEFVKARVYELPRKMNPIAAIIPRATDTPEWASTITYRMMDSVGMAQIIANYADDLPRVDVKGKEISSPVRELGNSFGYSWKELQVSQALGTPLATRKASIARNVIDDTLDNITLFGDADHGLLGLLSHPNIGSTVLSGKNWVTTATGDEIYSDLLALIDGITTQSKEYHVATHILLPTAFDRAARRKFVTGSNGKTAMERFKEEFPSVTIVTDSRLSTAGSGGKNLMMSGQFTADNIESENPMPFKQLPAEARNLEIVVNCIASSGGVVIRYPLAFTKAETV